MNNIRILHVLKHLFLVLVLSIVSSYKLKAETFPGYYIDTSGQRVETNFILRSEIDNINMPRYSDIDCEIIYLRNGKKQTLSPDKCKLFGFYIDNNEVVYYSKQNIYTGLSKCDSVFLRPKIEGPVTLYYHYYSHSTFLGISFMEEGALLENSKGETLRITYGGAKRADLARIFSDYPEMAEKILNKEIANKHIKNTEKMVRVYNKWILSH